MMDALPLHDARRAGLKEGIAMGEARGERRGLLAGERNAKLETAKQLLRMELGTTEQIATATQLSLDEVLKIKNEM